MQPLLPGVVAAALLLPVLLAQCFLAAPLLQFLHLRHAHLTRQQVGLQGLCLQLRVVTLRLLQRHRLLQPLQKTAVAEQAVDGRAAAFACGVACNGFLLVTEQLLGLLLQRAHAGLRLLQGGLRLVARLFGVLQQDVQGTGHER